ncbi:DUF871 domain-containing protein [Metabacillus iocasae]|uniref:Cell surface protein n=1 Tax=Priestia iocasae TaxID=2291674 RepID=A0ABS2QXE7_9BACI|nr:MupG family TIM beta-alpha barrel fold protein [Metabacillus iocasae]MBM7703928.1 hypothetical protein [Metabacillus iocasae]
MLGISLYLGQQSHDELEAYIKKMFSAGCRTIFTSLHIPEDDPALYVSELKKLGEVATRIGMDIIADLSPSSWHHLGLQMEQASELRAWGVTGLRVDYGFTPTQIANLSKQMKVALNASTIDERFLTELTNAGLHIHRVEAWHNFYPRPETGLDDQWFEKRNKWLQSQGLTVVAFVPGDEKLRGPLHKGLPTIERHRHQSVFSAYLEMTNELHVDKVCIGDPGIKEDTLKQFTYYQDDVIFVRCNHIDLTKEESKLLKMNHRNRMDPARDVIRSETSRFYAQKGRIDIKPRPILPRPKGAITIDNNHYGRYVGELQVVLRDLPPDAKVNVIGYVSAEDLPLLKMIHPGQSFSFNV